MNPFTRQIIGTAPCACGAKVGELCANLPPHALVHVERIAIAAKIQAQDEREQAAKPDIRKLWAELQRKKPQRRFNFEEGS